MGPRNLSRLQKHVNGAAGPAGQNRRLPPDKRPRRDLFRADLSQTATGSTFPAVNVAIPLLNFILGLGALYLGADLMIRGASRLARRLGVNALIIGLTVVAMGTSMPELLVGLVASVRESGDIAIR